MKLIGAAVARTGTLSLKAAPERLGYRTYHFEEAIASFERGDLDALVGHMTGAKPINWAEYLKAYDATADLPIALYYKEIMEAFPHAMGSGETRGQSTSSRSCWRGPLRMVDLS